MSFKEYLGSVAKSDAGKLKVLEKTIDTLFDCERAATNYGNDQKNTPPGYYSVPSTAFFDAQKYSMILLAETAKTIDPETKNLFPEVPWRKLNRIRNLFAHEVHATTALGETGYLQEAESLVFSEQELYASIDVISRHFGLDDQRKGLDELLKSQNANAQNLVKFLNDLVAIQNFGSLGSKVYADKHKPSRVLVQSDDTKTRILQHMCDKAIHFNNICLAEGLASLSEIFKLTHGSRENFPDINFYIRQRNSVAHRDFDKFADSDANQKEFAENVTKLAQFKERIPKRYLQKFDSKNNGLSVSYEGYVSAKLSQRLNYNQIKPVAFGEFSKAKLKILDEIVIPYFDSSPVIAPKDEQAYLAALCVVGSKKEVSSDDFKNLVTATLKDVHKDRDRSDIKPISGVHGVAVLSNKLNNVMTQLLGSSMKK